MEGFEAEMSSVASEDSLGSESSRDTSSCDLDSDTDTQPASTVSSGGIVSPRPSGVTLAPTRISPVPKLVGLAIPRLDLPSTPSAPPTALPQEQSSLLPLSAGKPALDLSGVRESSGHVQQQQQPLFSNTNEQLAIELLSPAFKLASTFSSGAATGLQMQCASQLGIRADRVQLFALMPVAETGDIPAGCQRVAVQVQGSDFSLQAIEDVLVENQKLAAMVSSISKPEPLGPTELERLRQEVAHLRHRLTSSELLRHRGQQALQELKEEFETLHFDLMQHTDTVLSARTPRPTLA